MATKQKAFVVICLRQRDGIKPDAMTAIQQLIATYRPGRADFVDSTRVVVYFQKTHRMRQGLEAFLRVVEGRSENKQLATLQLGVSEGLLAGDFTFLGHYKGGPLSGSAVDEAMRLAE